MANLPIYGFGYNSGSTNLPIYGYGQDLLVPILIPDTGSIIGGESFTIINSNQSVKSIADTFSGIILDPSLWTDISTGTGTATVSDSLILEVSNTGAGTAGIRSNTNFINFDVAVDFQSTVSELIRLCPTGGFSFLNLRARIDANNYVITQLLHDGTEVRLVVTLTQSAVDTVLYDQPIKSICRSLRMIRFNGRVLVYAGSEIIIDFYGWRNNAVTIDIFNSAGVIPVPLITTVTAFIPRLIVAFGNNLAPLVTETESRIVGTTPPYALPEDAIVQIHGNSTYDELVSLFTYTSPIRLSLDANSRIIIDDDKVLRDSSATNKRFRII